MKGITLIGMPGSGKSTIGKMLADVLKRKFADLDILILKKEGRSHADILEKDGKFFILEVNRFPGLESFEKLTKYNVGKEFLKYLTEK